MSKNKIAIILSIFFPWLFLSTNLNYDYKNEKLQDEFVKNHLMKNEIQYIEEQSYIQWLIKLSNDLIREIEKENHVLKELEYVELFEKSKKKKRRIKKLITRMKKTRNINSKNIKFINTLKNKCILDQNKRSKSTKHNKNNVK